MTAIVELWSSKDQARLERFTDAVEFGEPIEAIVELTRAPLTDLHDAIEAARTKVELAQSYGGALAVAASIATLIDSEWQIELEAGDDLLAECDLAICWENRCASPRTLAALWVYTAKRLGYSAHWLEMNVFHPIVLSDGTSDVMVDSTSGRMVSKADCREIFYEITDGDEDFLPEMFDPPTARDVAMEVLELRIAGATSSADETVAYQNMRFHAALHSDQPRVVFAAALAAAKIGDHVYATDTLRRLAPVCEGSELEGPIQQALQRIQSQFQYSN